MLSCFQFILQLCVCVVFYSSEPCIFICQVSHNKEFNHLEQIERPSQIPSFLHGVERRHLPKISSFRTSAHIVRRWWSRSPRYVRADVCQLRKRLDFSPTCSGCAEERWVRGATCSVLCFENESHIAHKSLCFLSQGTELFLPPPCCRFSYLKGEKSE